MIRLVATTTRTDARGAALEKLIDHAALFPPASMSIADALAEDRRVRASSEAWLVHRFVVPASRLADLPAATPPLSVVLDDPLASADDERIEAVELRHPGDLTGLAGLAPEIYVEIPAADAHEVASLAALGLRAKVRCGGAAVPSLEDLAGFVRACRQHGVVFKATAGLHHPGPRPGEHGFLNLLAAAVFGDEEEALADEDARAFRLDAAAFAWRHRTAAADEVARVRRELFVGFGSCSVAEPVGHLRALGILAG
jgi:hypothetical protein